MSADTFFKALKLRPKRPADSVDIETPILTHERFQFDGVRFEYLKFKLGGGMDSNRIEREDRIRRDRGRAPFLRIDRQVMMRARVARDFAFAQRSCGRDVCNIQEFRAVGFRPKVGEF